MIVHVFPFTGIFISSGGFLVLSSVFIPLCQTSFSIFFCRAGLVVIDSLSFCFIWEDINCSLTFEGYFSWIQDSWLTIFFFSFSSLNISAYSLWPPEFLMRNLLIILFSLEDSSLSFTILLSAFESLTVGLSSSLEFVELFECVRSCLSSRLGRSWSLFLQIFSLSLSLLLGLSRCVSWSTWWCLHRTLRFCSLFLNHLFSFCSSDLIILLSYLHTD